MAASSLRDPHRMPVHPGAILRDDILPGLGMTVTQTARLLGVTRQTLHRVLAGTAAVSPEMALRIGKFCGNGPEVWLRMQATFDLWHAGRRHADAIANIPTVRDAA